MLACLTGLAAGAPAAFAVGFPQRQTGKAFVDVRTRSQTAGAQVKVPALRANAAAALGRSLGQQSVVTIDPLTGTPSMVARLNGFLTARSAAAPALIALDYVRAHRAVFGLSNADLRELHEAPAYRSVDGTTHVRWMQQYRGVPVFENELRANVDRSGQLINVLGAPLASTAVASTTPRLNAEQALGRARQDGGAHGPAPSATKATPGAQRWTHFSDGSQADLVIFHIASGNELAWHLYAFVDSTHIYEYVINAASGRVLFRNNIVDQSSGEGKAWLYNPSPIFGPGNGLVDGHTQNTQVYPDAWGPISDTALSGNNAHVYSDVNDNNQDDAGEDVAPTSFDVDGHPEFIYPFSSNTSDFFENCATNFPCSWDRDAVNGDSSWHTNRAQNAAQVFWFVNNYHDHLEQSPIGFTPAAGNFQVNNNGQGGLGNDPVHAENDDGANTDGSGGPDDNHIDNANMATEQDGVPPRMQMYLFDSNNFVDANGGDEADVVYHEYTHGLSHRLITDAQGFPRLDGEEAGAMGEGWSDWYAMDYLVSQNLDTDTSTTGDVFLGYYVSGAQHLIRSMSMDCPVGAPANGDCQSSFTSHQGGYTLQDYGKISGSGPEVHADGEIWGQTLWQIRQALINKQSNPATTNSSGNCTGPCSYRAEQLITAGMELSPPDPSMLNERDAILQADQTDFGGADLTVLWQIFAQRGMGFFAADLGSGDTAPVFDFHTPPAQSARTATVTGRITDADSGAPVSGATVEFANHADLSTTTNSNGQYTIHNVAPHNSYPYVLILARGFDGIALKNVPVSSGSNTVSHSIRRDWASLAGGGQVKSVTAPNLTSFGCGPANAIDGSQTSGWGSYAVNFGGNPSQGLPSAPTGPRTVVIQLPHTVDIRQFAIDPGATCGDDDTASLRQFQIAVSSNGSSFHQVAGGAFGPSNDHIMNPVSLTGSGTGARFVRLTELSNQGPDSNSQDIAYQRFMDVSELEVYGTPGFVAPHAAFSVSGPHTQGASLTFNGSASTHDPSLSIAQYHWSFGDGSTGSGKVLHHAFHHHGTFTVTLSVKDSHGRSSSVSHRVAINGPCHVPNVKGKSLSGAKRALGSAGCGVGKVKRPSKKRKHKQLVVGSQSIPPGTTKPHGTKVGLTLVYK